MYPPGFDAHEVPLWDPNSPDGTTRPVSAPVAAEPPRIGHKVVRNVASGRYIHEERAKQKAKAAREDYTHRGSEQFTNALMWPAKILGRIGIKGTVTPPERRQPGHYRKEIGWARRAPALLGSAALHLTGIPALSYVARTGFRFSSNYIALKRTFKDSFRPVVAQENEPPHQLRGKIPKQSVYKNPHPKLGGNLPTSKKQARANNRAAKKQAKQTPPPQQTRQQGRGQAQNRRKRGQGI